MNVFVKCFENSLISIANYVLGATPALVEMSSRLTIQCNISIKRSIKLKLVESTKRLK